MDGLVDRYTCVKCNACVFIYVCNVCIYVWIDILGIPCMCMYVCMHECIYVCIYICMNENI